MQNPGLAAESGAQCPRGRANLPDWSYVHNELKRRSVTLLLLWEEYRAEQAAPF